LQKRYLHSKKQLPIVKLLKYVGIFIFTLLVILGIAWSVFVSLSKDVCLKYATVLTKDASYVHIIAEQNDKLVKDWEEFNNAINYETKPERIAVMQENMEKRINVVEKNLKQMWNVDSTKMEINSYHSFLLSIYGINAEEISVSPQFATLYYNDYLGQIELLRKAVREPNTLNRRYSTTLFEVFKHSINSYYASILSELSNFPESSLTTYNEMSKHWTYFPVYKLGEDENFYEDIINNETKQAEDLMTRFESVLEYKDAEMEDIERENESLEKQIEEGFSNLQSQVDSAAEMLRATAEIENIKKQNESEIAIRKEKVAAKKVALDATKAELEELDKQYVEAYENLKKKCTLEESEDQWYKWGKIRRWGNFLSMLVESRRDLKSQGVYSTSSVTPEVAYADMNSMLTVYLTYHPESKNYVASVKQFYRELSKDQRQYAGVMIFGFKDDAKHPYFKQGDIVVEYDGKEVKNYDSFKNAYKANNNGEVVFLRLKGSGFDKIKEPIKDTDIVGFLELTE
jgi:hypothetical protein